MEPYSTWSLMLAALPNTPPGDPSRLWHVASFIPFHCLVGLQGMDEPHCVAGPPLKDTVAVSSSQCVTNEAAVVCISFKITTLCQTAISSQVTLSMPRTCPNTV